MLTTWADTSEESKQHSKQVLQELGGEDAFYGKDKQGDDAPAAGMGGTGNVLGGHKATLSNPSEWPRVNSCGVRENTKDCLLTTDATDTSDEAKEHSKKVLEEAGAK
jgi:hypothetical protein